MTSRGIRNNNPGNIRKGDKWQGLAAEQPDSDFCTFTAPVWGIRAIVRLMIGYEKTGLNTVRKIINRWAPPVENDTGAYVRAVATAVGVAPDALIDVDSAEIMLPLVKAIISHENGSNPYPDSLIADAMRRAGIADAPQVPLTKKVTAQALVAASSGLALCSQLAEPAKQAAAQLADTADAPLIGHIRTILLTLAGLGALAMLAKTWVDHRKGL